jgi:hypothetical protein
MKLPFSKRFARVWQGLQNEQQCSSKIHSVKKVLTLLIALTSLTIANTDLQAKDSPVMAHSVNGNSYETQKHDDDYPDSEGLYTHTITFSYGVGTPIEISEITCNGVAPRLWISNSWITQGDSVELAYEGGTLTVTSQDTHATAYWQWHHRNEQ